MIQKGVPSARAPDKSIASPRGTDLERLVEAILFVGTEPLTAEAVCAGFEDLKPRQVRDAIQRLSARYAFERRPYRVRATKLSQANVVGYRLELDGDLMKEIRAKARIERTARLPRATIEVLSLVAYRQPITKVDLETLLGIDPSGPLRQLQRRGLIARHEATRGTNGAAASGSDRPSPEGPTYRTTGRFLELFHLSSLDELPASDEAL